MDPIIGGALIGGGFNMLGNMFNTNAAEQANTMNIYAARENREWQKWMSDTAHQREVADLKAAGLNPNLSAGGSGASSPGGATPTIQAPQIQLPSVQEVSSLLSLDQQQQKIDMEKQLLAFQMDKIGAGVQKDKADTKYTEQKTKTLGKGMTKALLESEGSDLLREAIKKAKDYFKKPGVFNANPPKGSKYEKGTPLFELAPPESSGGELIPRRDSRPQY